MDGVSLISGFQVWGGDIGAILQNWEILGIFEYVLPFVLVFAVVFGILHKSQIIGDNRGVNMVIALAVAGLSITSMQFRSFFRVLFPYAGVGVAILLVGMIMVGLFVNPTQNWWKYVFYGIGMFIAVVIVLSALSSYEVFFASTWWWQQYMSAIIVAGVVVGLILLVVLSIKRTG